MSQPQPETHNQSQFSETFLVLTEAVRIIVISRRAGVTLPPSKVSPAGTLPGGLVTAPVTPRDPLLGTLALLTVRVTKPALLASKY